MYISGGVILVIIVVIVLFLLLRTLDVNTSRHARRP
jgi:hypothetical protein